jgi:hypothetical protein
MHTAELISNYKAKYTPMAEDASIIAYYMRNSRPTGSIDKNPYCVIIINQNEANNNILPIATLDQFFSEQKDRNYMKLYSEFLLKWKEHKGHFKGFSESFVFENIKLVIDRFLSLNPSYVTFELTNDCSVFFQSLVNGNNIYLELYYSNDVKDEVEAITNIYKDGECVFAYGSTIENTFSKISSKVQNNYWLKATSQSAYDISEQTFASTQF